MFLALGVALSTLFTPVCSSTPQTNVIAYPVTYRSVAANTYQQFTDEYTQLYRFSSSNLNAYLLDSIEYTQDDYYQVDLVRFIYSDNDFSLNNFMKLSCYFEVYSYYPAPNADPVLYTRNYSFSFIYLDYDYATLPLMNFDMVYYCSQSASYGVDDAYFNKDNRIYFDERGTPENPLPMFNREIQDFYDFDIPGQLYTFSFYIEFHWLSEQIFDLAMFGYNPDFTNPYNNGYQSGYSKGLEEGELIGYEDGYSIGKSEGEQIGYGNGYSDALDQGATASIIFNGIISVGLLPVNVFLRMLNFEVFGINIGAFVSSLLTILVIIIIVRMFLGGKSGSE